MHIVDDAVAILFVIIDKKGVIGNVDGCVSTFYISFHNKNYKYLNDKH